MLDLTKEQLSEALELSTPIGQDPSTLEQNLAMMRAAEIDEDIHRKALVDATARKLKYAEAIKGLLPAA